MASLTMTTTSTNSVSTIPSTGPLTNTIYHYTGTFLPSDNYKPSLFYIDNLIAFVQNIKDKEFYFTIPHTTNKVIVTSEHISFASKFEEINQGVCNMLGINEESIKEESTFLKTKKGASIILIYEIEEGVMAPMAIFTASPTFPFRVETMSGEVFDSANYLPSGETNEPTSADTIHSDQLLPPTTIVSSKTSSNVSCSASVSVNTSVNISNTANVTVNGAPMRDFDNPVLRRKYAEQQKHYIDKYEQWMSGRNQIG